MIKIKNVLRSYLNTFSGFKWYNWLIFGFLVIVWFTLVLTYKIVIWFVLVAVVVVMLIAKIQNVRYIKTASNNGVIEGNRGKGKGILLQKLNNAYDKTFSNVPMGQNTEVINISEYINSIGNNTVLNTINGKIEVVKKLMKFEGVPVLWDDITVYAPNYLDNLLKQTFPSLGLLLAINRHLYNSFMVISVQNRERAYKLLRELQTDYTIRALNTYGFGKLWNSVPLLRFFVVVKYRYYEEVKSADAGVLPFKSIGALNKGVSSVYLTSGQATKDVYQAQHGLIYHGYVSIRKSKLYYNTRHFHEVFYGYKV